MSVILIVVSYLFGAIPMGYLTVKVIAKKDITKVGSGRTGGTNAMRAGGLWVGVLTAILDLLKGYLAVSFARWVMPGSLWTQVLAGAASVWGHNWSIWLYLLTKKFTAGAGTGPNVGAAMAFWPGILLAAIPTVVFFVFVVGYASVASIATALMLIVAFYLRNLYVGSPWEYVVYSFITTALVIWALRPNIRRLLEGTERRVGLFAKKNNQSYSSST